MKPLVRASNKVIEYLSLRAEKDSLSFFFAGICIFLLPVYTWYLPPFIILWILTRTFEIFINYKKDQHLPPVSQASLRLIVLFILFFLSEVISLFYSENISNGVNIVFSRLSLLLFPLLFIFPGRRIINNVKVLLKLFAWGTTLFIVFCFINAFYKSISFEVGHIIINTHPGGIVWLSYFFGSNFSGIQHPSYVAIFVVLSIMIALESVLNNSLKKNERVLWILASILLLASIYFLSSRAGFLIVFISVPFYFLINIKSKKKILVTSIFATILLIGTFAIAKTNERIRLVMEQISDGSFKDKIVKDSRVLIWKSSLTIIKNNPLLGVGIGDVRDELMKEYTLTGDEDLLDSRYNAHNQFLEIAMEGGLISLTIFLALMGNMVFIAISERNKFLSFFLIFITVFFMFETVIYRLAGVIFFSLFSLLLLFVDYPEKNFSGKILNNKEND